MKVIKEYEDEAEWLDCLPRPYVDVSGWWENLDSPNHKFRIAMDSRGCLDGFGAKFLEDEIVSQYTINGFSRGNKITLTMISDDGDIITHVGVINICNHGVSIITDVMFWDESSCEIIYSEASFFEAED